jgi:hypothetical protein
VQAPALSAADAHEARLAALQRGAGAAGGAGAGAGAGTGAGAVEAPLPRDPWLAKAESPDFFDELRRPFKKPPARPRHDHDVEPIELFSEPGGGAGAADAAFARVAVAGVLVWAFSLALLLCAVLRCCWCRKGRAASAASVRRPPVLPVAVAPRPSPSSGKQSKRI